MPNLAEMMQQVQGQQTPQQAPAQPGGLAGMMQSGQQPPQGASQGWSGTISVQGQPVQVQNGAGEFQGKQYFVSSDGLVVANEQKQLMGIIQDGQFVPRSPEIIKQLKEKGIVG